jgi:hypothetical protein
MSIRMVFAVPTLAATLFAQQTTEQSTLWSIDANGHRVDSARYATTESPAGSQRVETVQSINGRMVPLQVNEDRVLSQDPRNKVVERIIRKYDANGNLGLPIKVRIEETRNPDGSATIRSTAYESDINGNLQIFERTITEVRKSPSATATSVNVERATLNGGLSPVQRIQSIERPTAGGSQLESTTYTRDVSGSFTPSAQDVKQITKRGTEETTDVVHYELDPYGKLALYSRAIDRLKVNPDGSQLTETDVYSKFSAGKTGDVNADQPRLQEQIRKQRVPGPGGVTVETTSVRSRLPNDQSRFGNYETVGQTTYRKAAGPRELQSSESVRGRRDPNGEIAPLEGTTVQTVTIKPPAPPPAPAPKQP